MHIRTSFAVLGLTALLAAGGAQATLRMVEQAIETSTLSTSLPDDSTGSLAVSACNGCKPVLLRLSSDSKYFIGKTPVTYAQLRAAASNAARQLNVFYDAKGRTITRLVVSGQSSAPVRQPHGN
jgi:biopolymer transport protein ExbD